MGTGCSIRFDVQRKDEQRTDEHSTEPSLPQYSTEHIAADTVPHQNNPNDCQEFAGAAHTTRHTHHNLPSHSSDILMTVEDADDHHIADHTILHTDGNMLKSPLQLSAVNPSSHDSLLQRDRNLLTLTMRGQGGGGSPAATSPRGQTLLGTSNRSNDAATLTQPDGGRRGGGPKVSPKRQQAPHHHPLVASSFHSIIPAQSEMVLWKEQLDEVEVIEFIVVESQTPKPRTLSPSTSISPVPSHRRETRRVAAICGRCHTEK
ncbi:Hypothetical protein, putative [Bodo saltans]|uniref:Uncharacterized protein n=1 Tax=Bodo saltans TaxID=75058 RepID=A0A0S4KK58_BODSA|nr:Hypothetical protein, putative [Bodo saltans]|eukprot:CUI14964.1 Hypothetical protein, putative [Bodo saltans]